MRPNRCDAATSAHIAGMFAIDEESLEATCVAFEEHGELAAAVELRQRFPGIGDVAVARRIVRLVVGWQPIAQPAPSDRG